MTQASSKTKTGKRNQLAGRIAIIDLARMISILAVLCFHFLAQEKTKILEALPSSVSYSLLAISQNGRYGVTIFFVISGFVVSRMIALRYGHLFSIKKKDFYIRRIARIWPLLITTVLIGLCFASRWSGQNLPVESSQYNVFSPNPNLFDWQFFLSLISMTFNWLLFYRTHQYGLHWAILWSIAIEEQFYLLFPLVLTFLNSNKKLITLLLILIVSGPLARAWGVMNGYAVISLESSFAAFDLISLGILLFIVHRPLLEQLNQFKYSAQILCLCGFFLSFTIYLKTDFTDPIHIIWGPTLLALTSCMFLLGGLAWSAAAHIPQILTLPGKLSYGMYIYHPLLALTTVIFFPGSNIIMQFSLFILIVFVCSFASFYFYEQPLNKLICRMLIPQSRP